MKTRDFCLWLQGYLDCIGGCLLSLDDIALIKTKLEESLQEAPTHQVKINGTVPYVPCGTFECK